MRGRPDGVRKQFVRSKNQTTSTRRLGRDRLTKPIASCPAGKYRVEVKFGDKLVTPARFEIA